MTPKLFISYAHEPVIFPMLDYIVKFFKKKCKGKFELLVDRNLQTGTDLNAFMDQLDQCFGVILLYTPRYKERVTNKQGGVYYEYLRILDTQQKQGKKFYIWPILVSGDMDNSLLPNFNSLLCSDLSQLHILDGELIGPAKRDITDLLKSILRSAIDLAIFKNQEFRKEQEKVRKKLFEEPKADFNNPDNRDLIDQIIVKNNALQSVANFDALIIKGRKGSGKSTLTQVVPYIYDDIFLIDIPINANELDLDNIFANIVKAPTITISKSISLKRKEVFKMGWKLFIYLMYIDGLLLLNKDAQKGLLSTEDAGLLQAFFKNFHSEYDCSPQYNGKEKERRYNKLCRAYFPYAVSKVMEYIDHIKKTHGAKQEIRIIEWNTFFTEERFFHHCLSEQIINLLRNYTARLNHIGKKILVTLDNFDNTFYDERKSILNTPEYDKTFIQEQLIIRASKDTDLLCALIQIVYDFNNSKQYGDLVFSAFNFCITIPEDIYFDIERFYRDSYVFINKVQTIRWTGIELMILLRKRLEVYTGMKIAKKKSNGDDKSQEALLTEILKKKFPDIPTHIDIEFKDKTYIVPLFIYILRHTFWRPREIILYYADIISALNIFAQRRLPLTVEDIKIIVKNNATHIIEHEFLGEFDTTCINIAEIISSFRHQSQILRYEDLARILNKIQFQFTSQNRNLDSNTLSEKIVFLYQVGFLGLVLGEQKAKQANLHKYAFVFNAGPKVLLKTRVEKEKDLMEYTFIIHPIFFEYLFLNNDRNEEFVLNFNDEYLRAQDKNFTLLYT